MKKVLHFVPSMDIGGVEIAIEKSLPDLGKRFDIGVFYVKHRGCIDVGQKPWWRALKNIFVDRPDVVITSLWWAHPIGIFFKLAGIKWVCFIHNAGLTHGIDRLVCTAAIFFSDEIAADSDQAAFFIRSIKRTASIIVIPYVFPISQGAMKVERIKNSFIFVGRNTPQKRIDLVVGFFNYLLVNFSDVTCRFVISGDVPQDVLSLMEFFDKRIVIESNLPNNEVLRRLCASEYFVVLSDYEGFCMAANEAVQAGCFVIYRDVGEIKNYVLPDRSFKVQDLDNLFSQFGEVLKKRNDDYPRRGRGEGLEPGNGRGDTYTASFIALIERSTRTAG